MSRFEIKIVVALLLTAVVPLVASVVLVGQVIRVSDSVAEGTVQALAQPIERAAQAYRQLFAAHKRTFKLQAERLAHDHELAAAIADSAPDGARARLAVLLGEHPNLLSVQVLGTGRGSITVRRDRSLPDDRYRDLVLEERLGTTGARLRATFFTSRQPFDDFQALGRAERSAREISTLRGELPTYYRTVFLIIFGAVLLAATAGGILIARTTTRQVAVLARATQDVASGDLDTRVQIKARDELGELAEAFNEMVAQLRENRERISYLEKIGAWQEIARRLAHEIKNPLTPIQLAAQQLCDRYRGEDESFGRLLHDACDIITEEVEGLRRLVQAFSSFARLPSVQPEPVELATLVDDFFKSHTELVQATRRIDWQAPERPLVVMVDRMLIKHVLFNLVENAAQAVAEQGQDNAVVVTIAAEPDEARRRLKLTVSDDGPGMKPEVAARVFDPYFTTKEDGTGLGLAIVKKIILEHRGSITVSTQPGEGTRFTITLPLVTMSPLPSGIMTTISRLLGTSRGPAVPRPPSDDGKKS